MIFWCLSIAAAIAFGAVIEHAGYLRGIRETERRWHAAYEGKKHTDG